MSKFRSDLTKAYQKKVLGKLETSIRAVALVVDRELVLRTPVDTGRARANWLPSLNAPSVSLVEPGQKPDIGATLSSYKIEDTVFISNNLPYIQRLNNGYSKQAPAGFVEDAIEIGKRAIR